jgi:hypothetical protein
VAIEQPFTDGQVSDPDSRRLVGRTIDRIQTSGAWRQGVG